MKENSYKKINLILLILYAVNCLILFMISLSIFKVDEIAFFKFYFIGSFTIIPAILTALLVRNSFIYKNNDINDYSKYVPTISYIVIMAIIGIKISIQLEDVSIWMVVFTLMAFILLEVVITFIYRDKYISNKKILKLDIIYQVVSLAVLILFILALYCAVISVFANEYYY